MTPHDTNPLRPATAGAPSPGTGVTLHDVVAAACRQHAEALQRRAISLEIDVPQNHQTHVNRAALCDVLVRLIGSAVESMPAGGELVVTSVVFGSQVELEVADSGPGFGDAVRGPLGAHDPRLALGPTTASLAAAVRAAVGWGGRVTLANCPEGGGAVTLQLPGPAMRAAA